MDMAIPKYPSVAGQWYPIGSLCKGDARQRIENTTVDECREYAALLEETGFSLVSAREIPSGVSFAQNLFYEYENGKTRVFVFFDASNSTTFVTGEPFQALPIANPVCAEEGVAPTVTQLAVNLGMCYAVQLKNGEFILIDGGVASEEDERLLYSFLKEKTLGANPTVALWIFTHAHSDHIGMATGFLERYKEEVTVKAFAYQFSDVTKVTVTMENMAEAGKIIDRLEEVLAKFYPTATKYSLHTGQSYSFAGVEIEVLCTIDDTYPSVYKSLNDMSAALRMKFESGRTVLFLGDCMLGTCRRLAHTYGSYLKSDILQVAHHGLIGGDRYLYEFIDPELCFWPTAETVFLGKHTRHRYKYCLGEGGCDYNAYLRDESIRKRTHYHGSKTVTVNV